MLLAYKIVHAPFCTLVRTLVTCHLVLLHLIPFFTVGEDEVRSWDIPTGTNAHKAAGKIHSDIERGFIRAEVINYHEFIELGSLHKAKETGKLRLEGKEYIVQNGDIINFRFNV